MQQPQLKNRKHRKPKTPEKCIICQVCSCNLPTTSRVLYQWAKTVFDPSPRLRYEIHYQKKKLYQNHVKTVPHHCNTNTYAGNYYTPLPITGPSNTQQATSKHVTEAKISPRRLRRRPSPEALGLASPSGSLRNSRFSAPDCPPPKRGRTGQKRPRTAPRGNA